MKRRPQLTTDTGRSAVRGQDGALVVDRPGRVMHATGRERPLPVVARRIVRWRGPAVLVVIIVVMLGMAQTSPGHVLLGKLGLLEKPANYTSLSFQHPQALPEQLSSRQASLDISFVIHNAGAAPGNYQWSVVLTQGQATHRLAAGTASVTSLGEATITRTAKLSCTRGRARITVSLADPAEFIESWMACTPQKSQPARAKKERGVR